MEWSRRVEEEEEEEEEEGSFGFSGFHFYG
jgi:hypothetical protein